jgi:hypothetical protein
MKGQKKQPRIWKTYRNGELIGYARHTHKRSAEVVNLGKIETVECGTEDLIAIGRDGATVAGMEPKVDPDQIDWVKGNE